MHESLNAWGLMRKLTWQDVLLVLAVLLLARLLVLLVRWAVRHMAEKLPPRLRLIVLRVPPIARLLIDVGAIAVVIPMLVEPTFQNIVALLASIGLVLAFALKDYGSSLVAGMVTILENTYQPGDWIEVDGTYGEVKAIGLRNAPRHPRRYRSYHSACAALVGQHFQRQQRQSKSPLRGGFLSAPQPRRFCGAATADRDGDIQLLPQTGNAGHRDRRRKTLGHPLPRQGVRQRKP